MTPEFTFDEMIELIRVADDDGTIWKLGGLIARDAKGYCLFHLRLINLAIDIKIKEDVREDIAFIKKLLNW